MDLNFLYRYYPKLPLKQIQWHIDNDIDMLILCEHPDCEHPVNWNTHKKKYRRFCSSKCAHNSPAVKEKTKNTCLKKYGTSSNLNSPACMAQRKKTCLKKYGVDNFSKTQEFKDQFKNTCQEKYGVDNVSELNWIKDKITKTHELKYGRKRASQIHLDEISIEMKNDRDLMHHWHIVEKISITEIAKRLGDINIAQLCVHFRDNLKIIPIRHRISIFEKAIQDIIKNEYQGHIIFNDRSCLSPKEIDIWLPDINLAFECNGSYWHSELNNKNNSYHNNKTVGCANNGIHLIHIWEHSFRDNPLFIKSEIKKALNNNTKIPAEETVLVSDISSDITTFLKINDTEHDISFSVAHGLYHLGELYATIVLKELTNAKWKLKYTSKLDTSVMKGFDKLFKNFVQTYNPNSVMIPVDRMQVSGDPYKDSGFEYSYSTIPGCYYTKDYIHFVDDIPDLPNWKENGYDRIWDCGSDIWLWRKINIRKY